MEIIYIVFATHDFRTKSKFKTSPIATSWHIKLQNHRVAGVGWYLWKSSSPNPCSRRATLNHLHKTVYRPLLKISVDSNFTTSLWEICANHPHNNDVFPDDRRWDLLCFSLCLLPLVVSLGITEKSLGGVSSPNPLFCPS